MSAHRRGCVFCGAKVEDGLMCKRCGTAYDRWNSRSDGTLFGLIRWAAERGRRYALKGVRRAR